MSTPRTGLTVKQKLFVESYLHLRNAKEAARAAGYKGTDRTLESVGSENLSKPEIRQEIDRRLEPLILSANQVLSGLSQIAEADIADVLEPDGTLNLQSAKERGVSRLIKSLSFDKDTGKLTKVELYSAHEAKRDMAKYRQLMPTAIKLVPFDEADKAIDEAARTHGLPLPTGTENHYDKPAS